MALSSYAGITAAISDWEERDFTADETDEFILLTEARANRRLQADYRIRATTTVTTDSSGVGTVPTGFVGLVSITRNVLGSVPLKQVSLEALTQRNPYEIDADADVFTLLSSSQFQVSPVTEDDFVLAYSSVLSGLSATNTTNWLLSLAPDFYLLGCRAAAKAKIEDYQGAGILVSQADALLAEVIGQGNVAEYASAEMTLNGGGCVP
jgi:hypothetical protein